MKTPNLGYKRNNYAEEKTGQEIVVQSKSYWKDSFNRLKKNKVAMVCMGIIIILALVAILAPLISPYDPNQQNLAIALQSPSGEHLFGTDEYGRDILFTVPAYPFQQGLLPRSSRPFWVLPSVRWRAITAVRWILLFPESWKFSQLSQTCC